MTTSTENLGLVLYDEVDDASKSFLSFRKDMSGTNESNMKKLDEFAGTTNEKIFKLEELLGEGVVELKAFHYFLTAESDAQTEFEIPMETFDAANDVLFVYNGITNAFPEVDYTVSGRVITLAEGVPAGTTIGIRVLKNVQTTNEEDPISGALLEDGSVTFDKLGADVTEALDDVKKSVSDGKALVADAITEKGIETATDAEFAVMAENIMQIETGIDTSDATAGPEHILEGYSSYSKGVKVEGSIPVTLPEGELDSKGYIEGVPEKYSIMNLDNWNETSLPIDNISYSVNVAYGNDKFVVLTSGSNIAAYSEDGVNWQQIELPTDILGSIAYGNNRFVAVGNEMIDIDGEVSRKGISYYSEDGVNWILGTSYSEQFGNIYYINEKFMVQTYSNNIWLSSSDGITWEIINLPTSDYIYMGSIAYGNGRYIMLAYDEDVGGDVGSVPTDVVIYSDDGITWVVEAMPSYQFWGDICYGNNKFVAIAAHGGWGDSTSVFAYSEDGINWTESTLPVEGYWADLIYATEKFILISSRGDVVLYSEDGINWAQGTLPKEAGWDSVCYGEDKFVAVGDYTDENSNTIGVVAYAGKDTSLLIPVPNKTYLDGVEYVNTCIGVTEPVGEVNGFGYIEGEIVEVDGVQVISIPANTYLDGVRYIKI